MTLSWKASDIQTGQRCTPLDEWSHYEAVKGNRNWSRNTKMFKSHTKRKTYVRPLTSKGNAGVLSICIRSVIYYRLNSIRRPNFNETKFQHLKNKRKILCYLHRLCIQLCARWWTIQRILLTLWNYKCSYAIRWCVVFSVIVICKVLSTELEI